MTLLFSALMPIGFAILGLFTGAISIGYFFIIAVSVGLLYLYLGFSHVLYILYEDPQNGFFSAVSYSFQLAKGNRLPLMGLFFLFSLILALGLAVFIVGVFFSLVYYHMTRVEFYKLLQSRSPLQTAIQRNFKKAMKEQRSQ